MNCIRRLNPLTLGSRFSKRSISRGNKTYQNFSKCLYSTNISIELPKVDPNETPISVSTPVGKEKNYDAKLVKIVDDISKLTLLEVSELNELLKKTLNIPDAPMMGAVAMGALAAPPPAEEEEEVVPQKVQTSFTLKLLKFDDAKKVALIKEVKNLLEGMNLVQAKKFVESAPTVVKSDIPRDEAEKLLAAFQAVGGTCEIV